MASEEHPPDDIALPMAWVGFDDAPILFANQFLGQHQPGEAIITIGQATAPPLVGTPEEVRAQARELTYIAVRPLVRLGLTKARLQELIAVLEITKLRMEAAEGEADPLK